MTFDYIRFTEEWASIYKPMMHSIGSSDNRRFFITDSYMTMVDFMANMDPTTTPCVITESQQEGNVDEGWDYPRYSFYFMVRGDEMNDGKEAVAAKRDAKTIMMDFINFIRMFKRASEDFDNFGSALEQIVLPNDSYLSQLRSAIINGTTRCMDNLAIESYTYESLNQMHDGWYGIQFTLDDKQLINLCADTSLYN